MTPEKRLDQLEPVLDEVVAQLDLHTAQLRRVNTGIATLITTTSQQNDDIAFLLQGQAEQRQLIDQLLARQSALEARQATLEAGQATLEAGQAVIVERLDGFQQILVTILNAVQRPSGD